MVAAAGSFPYDDAPSLGIGACGRYTITAGLKVIAEELGAATPAADDTHRYNVALLLQITRTYPSESSRNIARNGVNAASCAHPGFGAANSGVSYSRMHPGSPAVVGVSGACSGVGGWLRNSGLGRLPASASCHGDRPQLEALRGTIFGDDRLQIRGLRYEATVAADTSA